MGGRGGDHGRDEHIHEHKKTLTKRFNCKDPRIHPEFPSRYVGSSHSPYRRPFEIPEVEDCDRAQFKFRKRKTPGTTTFWFGQPRHDRPNAFLNNAFASRLDDNCQAERGSAGGEHGVRYHVRTAYSGQEIPGEGSLGCQESHG